MRSKDLRPLQPFFTAIEGYAEALSRDTSACRCVLTAAGRWDQPSRGCPFAVVYDQAGGAKAPGSCRTIVHVVVRAHLAWIRLGVDHITDPELDDAVEQLRALCLTAPEQSAEDFAIGIQRSLHAERVAGDHS